MASDFYILVLFSSLNEALELGNATARGFDRANVGGTIGCVTENCVSTNISHSHSSCRRCHCSGDINTFAFERTSGDDSGPQFRDQITSPGCFVEAPEALERSIGRV